MTDPLDAAALLAARALLNDAAVPLVDRYLYDPATDEVVHIDLAGRVTRRPANEPRVITDPITGLSTRLDPGT